MFQTFCKDEIFISMQSKVKKGFMCEKVETFAEFIFADNQYYSFLRIWAKSAKINSAKKSSAQISSANNFFP